MKKTLFLLLVLLKLAGNAFAYPIEPRTLRQLVQESEYIIVGYVESTYKVKKRGDNWFGRAASIKVLETLKGFIPESKIKIEFNPGMICPAPDVYFDDTYVISFLKKENNKYYTHALSYGVKTLAPDRIEAYKEKIAQIQSIVKIENKTEQFKQLTEWLVGCVENKDTRWDATYEINSNFIDYKYTTTLGKVEKIVFSDEQLKRIKQAVLTMEEAYVFDFVLIDLIYKGNEHQVDSLLLSGLKQLKEDDFWLALGYMNRLAKRTNQQEAQTLIKRFNEILHKEKSLPEKKDIIKRFIELVEGKKPDEVKLMPENDLIK
jgi:hypothetical protein